MSWKASTLLAAAMAFVIVVARLTQDAQTGTATWDASRAAGFVAYLLLWLSTVTGIALQMRWRPAGTSNNVLVESHRITSVLALSFVFAHVLAIVLDPVVRFSVLDALVPFTSTYRPLQVGAGTLAQWMLVTVLTSTALAGFTRWSTWRNIHYISFPCYVLSLVHGLTAGSDSAAPVALLIYAATASIIAAVSVARVFGRNWVPAEA